MELFCEFRYLISKERKKMIKLVLVKGDGAVWEYRENQLKDVKRGKKWMKRGIRDFEL